METTRTFELNFKSATGANKKVTIRDAKAQITAQEASHALQAITDSRLFVDQDGIDVYVKPVNARYVTRVVETVFDISEANA